MGPKYVGEVIYECFVFLHSGSCIPAQKRCWREKRGIRSSLPSNQQHNWAHLFHCASNQGYLLRGIDNCSSFIKKYSIYDLIATSNHFVSL